MFLPMAVGFAKGLTASKVSEMADSVVKSRTTIEESIAAYPGPAPAHTIRSERLELRQAERLEPPRSLRKRLSRRRPTASPIAENQAPERRRWIIGDYPKFAGGPLDSGQITEYEDLDLVEAVAERYEDEHGAQPLNLSHWDPSPDFRSTLDPWLSLDTKMDPVNYVYSYTMDSTDDILRRLGFDPATKSCLVTPCGTTSMLCAVNWTATRSKRLTILNPFYFPALHQAKQRGLAIDHLFMRRHDRSYSLPDGALNAPSCPVWLTSPVYCTGVRLSHDDKTRLLRFLENGGTLIADECLAVDGEELGRSLGHFPTFVGIYSPHKAVCLNGMKFSVIVFDRKDETFFNQWADVLYGGLGASTVMAIRHYLSADFARYGKSFTSETARSLETVKKLAALCPAGELDRDTAGHFVTFYIPSLPATLGTDQAFLWDLVRASGALAISGLRNHFDPSCGFCFRINLALDDAAFRGALGRTMRFLAVHAGGTLAPAAE